MKKILFFLLLTFVGFNATAQEEQIPWKSTYPQDIEKKYELKLNAFNFIALSAVDISYERLINANSSFGVAVFYNFANYAESDVVFPKKSFIPHFIKGLCVGMAQFEPPNSPSLIPRSFLILSTS